MVVVTPGCRSCPGMSLGHRHCPACTLPVPCPQHRTREQWRSTAVTSSGLRRRAAVSWMCGSRASGSLPLGCKVAMPAGPRMLARRLFSGWGTARRGGQRGRDLPRHPTHTHPPCLPPQQLAPHQSWTDTHSAGPGACRACPAVPPGHMGTPITPLQAPDDKLLHSAYCKGDGQG